MSTPEKNIEVMASPQFSTDGQSSKEELRSIDPAIEKRVLRKLDFQVMPVLFFLFLVSFVDRGNIANAKIQGMTKSLKLVGHDYNMAVMVFTLAYVVFGIPANLVFKKFGPKTLSIMMFIWGFCALGQGLVNTYSGLVALRILMGIFEAGFVPGCAYLIGSYYTKDEFLKRYTVFFSAAILAGAFNGLLATLFSMMKGVGGYPAWRWIFIMEGLITIVAAFFSYFVMIPFPEQTTRFSPEEKEVILARIALDGGQTPNDSLRTHVIEALTDWKVWVATIAYIGAEENASSVVAFQPTVLKGLGYSSTEAQIHSIPIYMVAFVLSLTCAYCSEKLRQRYVFAVLGATFNLIGLSIEIAQPKAVGVRYLGLFFLASGSYIIMPIVVVWLAINVGKGYKRAVAFAMVTAVGNCGAFISSNVFITAQSPKYHTGFAVGLGMDCLCFVALTVMYLGLRWENRKRDRKQAEMGEQSGRMLEGDKSPAFRFQL